MSLVKINEMQQPQEEEDDIQNMQISAPTGGRKVAVDWHAGSASPGVQPAANSPASPSSAKSPPLPARSSANYGGNAPPSNARPLSASSSGAQPGATSQSAAYGAPTTSTSGSLLRNSAGAPQQANPLVFGVPIKTALCDATGKQIYKVPAVITDTIEQLTKRGLKEEGIFRLGGSHAALQQYKARYNQGERPDLSKELDINNVSGILKMWFRELPESIFPQEALQKMNSALSNPFDSEGLVTQYLSELPEANLLILKLLFPMLQEIVNLCKINLMTTHNLAIIFTQSLRISAAFFTFLIEHPAVIDKAKPMSATASSDLLKW